MSDKFTTTDNQMALPLDKTSTAENNSMSKMTSKDIKALNKSDESQSTHLPEVSFHDSIQDIKASSGDDRADKIAAVIGEKAASSHLAQQLFPELAPHTRGVAAVPEGHVDLTNPNDPDYTLPSDMDRMVDCVRLDMRTGKLASKDIINMLGLAKDIDTDNNRFLPASLAACGMSCFRMKNENGVISDQGIKILDKTDVQEIEALRDSYKLLSKKMDKPDLPVKIVVGDVYPPIRGTRPAANLEANIQIVDDFVLPALKEALKQ